MENQTTTPQAPADFVYVSRETFFAAINPLNIHPTPARTHSEWRMLDRSRGEAGRMLGWSYGTLRPQRQRYALHPELVAELIRAGVK